MAKEHKQDQIVGVRVFVEQREGSKVVRGDYHTHTYHLCACHCAGCSREGDKMNSTRAYPRSNTVLQT